MAKLQIWLVCFRTGKGITGESVSESSDWADRQQSRHCAVVSDKDLMWQSVKCSDEYNFYCSAGDTIHYHHMALGWHNASLSCQENSNNLATITQTNRADLNQTGWIGLYREAGETWSWIGNLPSDYRNWAPGEPLNADCASFDPVTEAYHSKPCSKELPFLCYDDNLVVVKENKTWEEALKHCQTMEKPCSEPPMPCLYQYSLLSLEHFSNYDHIRDRIYKATTDEVWEWVPGFANKSRTRPFSLNTVIKRIKLVKRFLPHGAGLWRYSEVIDTAHLNFIKPIFHFKTQL